MSEAAPAALPDAVRLAGIHHAYGKTRAVDGMDLTIAEGSAVALVGPDGVGKSTLLGLIAGAKRIQTGRVEVLGADFAARKAREEAQPRIAFMPQGLGRNLCPSLSVAAYGSKVSLAKAQYSHLSYLMKVLFRHQRNK